MFQGSNPVSRHDKCKLNVSRKVKVHLSFCNPEAVGESGDRAPHILNLNWSAQIWSIWPLGQQHFVRLALIQFYFIYGDVHQLAFTRSNFQINPYPANVENRVS
jgi:hypothetical protein